MDPSHPAPAQRAADSDRESAAETLRAAGTDGRLTVDELEHRLAAVFAARTHPELDLLLADLQGRQELTEPLARPSSPSAWAQSQQVTPPETHVTRTIMGNTKLQGYWRPAADSRVITVMGDTTIDLSDADLSRPVTHMRVVTVMGSTKIEVPDDVTVHVTKVTIMGESDIATPDTPPLPGAPELHIRLVSVMGEAKLRFSRRRERRNELYA